MRTIACLYQYLVFLILAFSDNSVVAQNETDNSRVAITEADLLWPREGDIFALSDKGMAVIVAIQNYAEAQKHGWSVSWLMCQDRTDNPIFRECTYGNNHGEQRLVLRNDSMNSDGKSTEADDANESDVYVELNHSYWYSSVGRSDFNFTFGGVYTFEWKFDIGPWCEFSNVSTEYAASHRISGGIFNVTLAPSADYPKPTAATCASFLGAVRYVETTTYDFRSSVANNPGCVQTQPVEVAPTPCRATLNPDQLNSAAALMGWDGRAPGTTLAESSTETQRSLATGRAVSVAVVNLVSFLISILGNCL